MSKSMYDIIKKQNGEAFARAIRDTDAGIFDIPNLQGILKFAGRNPLVLIKFLRSLKIKTKSQKVDTLDPFVLLKRAGYDAFYADTLEKQNSIKPYFAKGEALCTFIDSSRYKNYHIIHCVKEGADKLNRADFLNREIREDVYGTSVISIQILKEGGFIKITNRYNHTVNACDNTFNSNPDNIIVGLNRALKHHFDVDFCVPQTGVPNGFVFQNGCLYQYRYEQNNCYLGRDFYLKDGKVFPLDKNSQMMVDNFIIDLKEKKILNPLGVSSSLYDVLKVEIEGFVWQVEKRGDRNVFFADRKEIFSTKDGFLKTLYLRKMDKVVSFLSQHPHIEELYGYSLVEIGKKSLSYCPKLRYVHLPRCEKFEEKCFEGISSFVEAPLFKRQGIYFVAGVGIDTVQKKLVTQGCLPTPLYDFLKKNMCYTDELYVTEFPDGAIIYSNQKGFMHFKDNKLISLCLPEKIHVLEKATVMDASDLREFSASGVHLIEDANFLRCSNLEKIELPNAKFIGYNCLNGCPKVEELYLPKVEKMPMGVSLCNNSNLRQVYAPNLYVYPEFYLLPSLERFDCARGVYLRQLPTFVGENKVPAQKFVFMKREENER